jgi:hypothetical protein
MAHTLQHVNLIPYNPTNASPEYKAPKAERLHQFHQIMYKEYGIATTVRVTMGQDVDGACGQLVLNSKAKREQQQNATNGVKDIEDVVSGNPSRVNGLSKAVRRKQPVQAEFEEAKDKTDEGSVQVLSTQGTVESSIDVWFYALVGLIGVLVLFLLNKSYRQFLA